MTLQIQPSTLFRMVAGAVIVAGGLILIVRRPPPPPSAQFLTRHGLTATPIAASEPVSRAEAEAVAHAAVPNGVGGKAPRYHAELVEFSDRHNPALRKPEPAWLITWRQQSIVAGRYDETMNAVVSAKTKHILDIFASP